MTTANRAPRWPTVLLGLALTAGGIIGTFVPLLPEAVGLWSYVAATAVLLTGVFLRRI